MKEYYAIKQEAEKPEEADVVIFGELTSFAWADGDTSAARFAREINALDVKRLNVHIKSLGGEVNEGWAIYNALIEHPAKVTTYADGIVASAALFPFLAGDERIASSLSAFYLHQVMTGVYGYANDLRTAADELDIMTSIGIKAFTERADMTADETLRLMQAETWLKPEEALEYGIATSISRADKPKGLQQNVLPDLLTLVFGEKDDKKAKVTEESKKTEQKAVSVFETLNGIFNA